MLHHVELVVDDPASPRPFQNAFGVRLPHVHTGRGDTASLPGTQLATKELIQRLFLPLGAEPQRFPRLQIAHYRQELLFLPQIDFIHAHLPQHRLCPALAPPLQISQIDGPHRAGRQTPLPRHLSPRRAFAGSSHGLFESLAERRFARQLLHLLGLHPTLRAAHPVQLDHYRRLVCEARQVPHFPLVAFVDCRHPLAATTAHQPPIPALPPHPQFQRLPLFVDLALVYPIPRPSQNLRPLVVCHPP